MAIAVVLVLLGVLAGVSFAIYRSLDEEAKKIWNESLKSVTHPEDIGKK